ncbi:MAG: isoprenylcysteine carboxylmethyltransferase family protein [Chloroflexota bacterium]
MEKSLIFIALSIPIVYVSRNSLRAPRSHGFFRFFAWEAILALVLLNFDCWFCDPFAAHQIVSWVLLIISIYPVVEGIRLLRRVGKPSATRPADASLLEFEKTTTLVTTGLYKYIRHPLYSSLLFLTWGTFFKVPSWLGGIFAIAATLFLIATAKAEEVEDVRFFGPAYETYRKQSKMFIPFLF